MTNRLLTIAFLTVIKIVFSQTNVSGPYFNNTVWDVSGSPYNVVADVQIPTGTVLTIEKGVVVNFASGDHQILIKGTIVAKGTAVSPIKFNGHSQGAAMIMFKSTNLFNSSLSNIVFEGPKTAFQLADESEFNIDPIQNFGVLHASNIVFSNTHVKTKGYQTAASMIIDSSRFSNTNITGVYPRSEAIEIRNSDLKACNVSSESYNYGITLRNCTVATSVLQMGCCDANFNIISSIISASKISDGGGSPVNGKLKITSSRLDNTPVSLPAAELQMTDSKVNYNTLEGLVFGSGFINCSKIKGVGTGNAVNVTGYVGYDIGGEVSIKNTTIADNSVGIKVTNANIISIDSCNIESNSSYNLQNLSSKSVTAKNNWWGAADVSVISNKIYDYYKNINYGVVSCSNQLNTVYNSKGCADYVDVVTSVSDNEAMAFLRGFNIYPNPTAEHLNLEFKSTDYLNNELSIEIINAMGETLYEGELNKQVNTINVSNFNKGIHYCKLKSGGNVEITKILIQ